MAELYLPKTLTPKLLGATAMQLSIITLTYKKWSGSDERARIHQTACLFLAMWRTLRRLGIPMSSQTNFSWAWSTSFLVGAASNCMHRFEALRRRLDSKLIKT